MTLYFSTLTTPFGPFSLATDEEGFVRCSAFGSHAALQARATATALADASGISWQPAAGRHAAVARQVGEYGDGARREFSVRVRTCGSAFQERVWQALLTIPAGTTRSYGELARGLKTAPRAVGRANALNPVCLFLPCHRVIGGDGSLTGFAFGNPLKAKLLQHEAAASTVSHSSVAAVRR